MTLVDSSVWIDFFKAKDTFQVKKLESLLKTESDIAICGIILTEILQGISDDSQLETTRSYLQSLIMLEIDDVVWLNAAGLYRRLRKRGITIRRTNDCLIAAVALQHNCCLLHSDRDFKQIAANSSLIIDC